MNKVPRKSRHANYKRFSAFHRSTRAAFAFDARGTAQVAYSELFDKPAYRCNESGRQGHCRAQRAFICRDHQARVLSPGKRAPRLCAI